MAKRSRLRSPAYPAVNLEQAIGHAQTIYNEERRSLVPVQVALDHLGYGESSSNGMRIIAALKQFGLMAEEGKKDDRQVQLSSRALDILIAPSDDSPDRLRAIRDASLAPTIHQELWDEHDGDLPSDATLRANLVRNRDFNDNSVDRFIREFRDTIAFADLAENDTIDEEKEGDDPPEDEFPEDRTRVRRKPPMTADVKENVLGIDEGELVLQRPSRMSQSSAQDALDWLELMARQIKRSIDCDAEDQLSDE